MYTHFFGLTAEPFSLSPDPTFFFLSEGHANALAALKIGIHGRRGLMVMTGEVGTGKTTLLYSLLGDIGPRVHTAYISNTKLSFDSMLRLTLDDFGINCPAASRPDMLSALNGFLLGCAEQKSIAVLVVDEAQNLDEEAFEQIRLLSNFETFSAKLLQIVLVGQPELELKLQRRTLRQVTERVAVRCQLDPLSKKESRDYLDYRLRKVQAPPDLFSAGARRVILRAAQGIPRRINILCDNALLFTFGRERGHVSSAEAYLAVSERAALLGETSWLRRRKRRRIVVPRQPRAWAAGLALVVLVLAIAASVIVGRADTTAVDGPLGMRRSDHREKLEMRALYEPAQSAQADELSHTGATDLASAAPKPRAKDGDTRRAQSDDITAAETAATAVQQPVIDMAHVTDRATDPQPSSSRVSLPHELANADGHSVTPPTAEIQPRDDTDDSRSSTADEEVEFRDVQVTAGVTLTSLALEVYGVDDPELIDRIQSANPQVIDPNRILAGDTLRFPVMRQTKNMPVKEHP